MKTLKKKLSESMSKHPWLEEYGSMCYNEPVVAMFITLCGIFGTAVALGGVITLLKLAPITTAVVTVVLGALVGMIKLIGKAYAE